MIQILGEINRVVLCNRVNYYCIAVEVTTGSWNIENEKFNTPHSQALGKVMTANYMKEDLVTVMTKVTEITF